MAEKRLLQIAIDNLRRIQQEQIIQANPERIREFIPLDTETAQSAPDVDDDLRESDDLDV